MTDLKPARRRMSASDRRDQILDVTRECVAAEGFHMATIERIAHLCGVTRTLIYQQFGSLSGLLVAMVDREVNRAGKGLNDAMKTQTPEKTDRFLYTLAGIFKAVEASPATWRMFLMPSEGGPPALYERLAQAVEFTRNFLRASLAELDPNNLSPAAVDRELTVHLMYAMGEELIRLYLQDPLTYPVPRLLKQAERMSLLFYQRAGVT